jgi:hypothetical protein
LVFLFLLQFFFFCSFFSPSTTAEDGLNRDLFCCLEEEEGQLLKGGHGT